jgi:HEPN domain-containing protein
MSLQDIIAHWQRGARDSLETAEWNFEAKKYELALFHCHLAVEKALKSAYLRQYKSEPPKTHDLYALASKLTIEWTEIQKEQLEELKIFATEARYSEPQWAQECANPETVKQWLGIASRFLSMILP